MKITFIGHASILVEVGEVAILSDPWWNGSCFGAQWWLYPSAYLEGVQGRRPDYIYISHGHHDHFHPPTLKLFDRRTRVLVSREADLAPAVRALGFDVIAIGSDEEYPLRPGLCCRIITTHSDDSLMTLTDGTSTCINANDALHACPTDVQNRFVRRLRALHPSIDYLFCGYAVASHFPNSYRVPGKDDVASAVRRQRYFNRSWARIVHKLAPRFAFPFAADTVFLDQDLFWTNEPVHNAERPTDVFQRAHPSAATKVRDIAPGFVIEDGVVVADRRRQPVLAADLRVRYADTIQRVNRHARVDRASFGPILDMVERRVDRCRAYLATFPGDYQALLRFHGCDQAIRLAKKGRSVEVAEVSTALPTDYDITYTTRISYLRTSLTTPYGHEVLFVGSGGIFEYQDASRVGDSIHRELIVLLRPTEMCPPPRVTGFWARVRAAKQLAKRLRDGVSADLYNLEVWTVRSSKAAR